MFSETTTLTVDALKEKFQQLCSELQKNHTSLEIQETYGVAATTAWALAQFEEAKRRLEQFFELASKIPETPDYKE